MLLTQCTALQAGDRQARSPPSVPPDWSLQVCPICCATCSNAVILDARAPVSLPTHLSMRNVCPDLRPNAVIFDARALVPRPETAWVWGSLAHKTTPFPPLDHRRALGSLAVLVEGALLLGSNSKERCLTAYDPSPMGR